MSLHYARDTALSPEDVDTLQLPPISEAYPYPALELVDVAGMYVCVCVCMCLVCMSVCVRMSVCVCTCVRMCVYHRNIFLPHS